MREMKQQSSTLHIARPAQKLSPLWWFKWVPAVILLVLFLDFMYIIGKVALIPILASLALAYILNPLVLRVERFGLSRPLAAIVALLIVALLSGGVLLFIIPDLWEQGATAGQKILRYFSSENAARQRDWLRSYSPTLDRLVGERIEQILRNPSQALGSPGAWFAGGLSGFLATALASLDLLLVPFLVFYILVDFRKWRASFEDLIPPRFQNTFSRLFDEVGRILESYVHGQLLIALCMAVLYAVGFAVLRVPAWAGIAALAGLLNATPYIGTALGLVLATGFTLADGGGLWRVFGVLGVFAIVQSIEGYYLTPRILGARLSLHPIAVLLGLLIGGKLFGLLGIILAVPTIAIAKVFLKFLRELYKGSHFYHAGKLQPDQVPSEVLEERLADAADVVLAEQEQAETGEELLATDTQEEDVIARERVRPAA